MSCEQLRDEYELYALGLADEPELGELREHLERGCAACTAGVRSARALAGAIAASAPAVVPRPALRRRILASVGAEPHGSRGWLWSLPWVALTAFSLVAVFYFYGRDRDNALQLARSRAEAREQAIELARLNDALAILNRADTKQVVFGQGAATAPPRGRVFVNPQSGVLLLASNLPPAPAGKIYEMWVIPKTGTPVPAGLFQSDASNNALHVQNVSMDLAAAKAVAVTLEPAGGVPQPTSQPLIVAALSD